MAGLLERLTDVFNGGPIIRRHPAAAEQRVATVGNSLAEMLAYTGGRRSYAGVPVDNESALRLGAVWACVDLLSELVSTLPVDEFRRVEGGPPEHLSPSMLLTDPAGDGTGFEVWCRQVMTSLLLRGNAFGFIESLGGNGWPEQIEVLNPDRVSLRRELNFGPAEWLLDNKPIERWPAGPLWHLPAYPTPGSPVGMSPIRYAAETIGLGLATQRFGAQWFGDGAHPTAIIESDNPIDEDQAKTLKARVLSVMADNRQPLVMGAGTKLTSIQVSPEESQFLETIQANVADIARFFRVPPETIGGKAADGLTYANQEQRGIALLTFTLNPWLVRLERSLSRLVPRQRFVKFNADALLRVDLKTRYEAHVLAIRGGFATPNERRRLEDENPHEGADELLWPPYAVSETPPEGSNGPTQPA